MRKIRSILIVFSFVSLLLTPLACNTQVTPYEPSSEHKLSIEERVDRLVAGLPDEFSGTILLGIGDTILMNKGYGMADRASGIPNTAETKYEIASVTKDFTTILVFKLVELGLLELDQTIDLYLPEFPEDKASKITIHDLLLHTSGMPNHVVGIPDFIGMHDRIYHTPRELIELFSDLDLVHQPGEQATYSSSNYWLLTHIMETVTSKSFAELLDEYILTPLGMESTYVENNLTVHDNLAVGYWKGLGGYVLAPQEVHANTLGAGDMVSTAEDLYRFQRILSPRSEQILSDSTWESLFEVQFDLGPYKRTNMATLAYIPYNNGRNTLRILGIGAGGNYGFQSRMTRLIDHDAAYIVLSNVHNDRTMTEHTLYNYLQDVLCEELGIPIKMYEDPYEHEQASDETARGDDGSLRELEGIYRIAEDDYVACYVEDGRLHYHGYRRSNLGRGEVRGGALIPYGDHVFFDINYWFPQYFSFVPSSEIETADESASDKYQLIRRDPWSTEHVGLRTDGGVLSDSELDELAGLYYSVELQETFTLGVQDDRLVFEAFLGERDTEVVYLEPDLFHCRNGFLVFHRYDDGEIRDFWLMNENLDHIYGSLFIRK